MTNEIWIAIAGAVGTIIGGTISVVMNRRANQIKFTFEMHKEFNTPEMSEIRTRAQQFLLHHPDNLSLSDLYDQHPIEANRVWVVIQFYQRLWLAIDCRQVKANLVAPLFGEDLVWWHRNCVEKQVFSVPVDAELSDQLKRLLAWIGKKTNASTLTQWEQRAEIIGNPARLAALAERRLAVVTPSPTAGTPHLYCTSHEGEPDEPEAFVSYRDEGES